MMSWTAWRPVVGCGAQNNPRVAGVSDDHEVPLFEDGQRGAAALDRVQAPAALELAEHSGACGHVGLLPEVGLTVVKLLLVVDERRQRERLLPVVFVRGFQVKTWIHLWRWFMKMTYKSDPWKKILRRINITHIKKEFKLKTLFKQKKLHVRLLFK
jgi:heme/copper-type cytochrome/quinol oxidase subunit 4